MEKRGMYYLARRLSSQLSLVTDKTDYGELEKCYSIWICRDDILGNKEYNGKREDEGYKLLRFLNAVMYPHKADFMETVSEYIDFSENSELWKETERMGGLGQSIRDECLAEGLTKGIEQEIEHRIEIFILDNLEEQIPRERIIAKLQRRYELTKETAETYYERFKVS